MSARAKKIVREALAAVRWREIGLAIRPKGDPVKAQIAQRLRPETPMTRRGIAERLRMGSASYVLTLVSSVDSKL